MDRIIDTFILVTIIITYIAKYGFEKWGMGSFKNTAGVK